ncbi:MAG: hypothetical protein IPN98_05030 [Propionivibrio sp.]|nr:hypothetical protein [Propionivibrio sp.]
MATERPTELGGQAVEGMLVEQYFDRFDESPRYKAFHKAFSNRFGQERVLRGPLPTMRQWLFCSA